jgi:hypothetical protein
VARPKPFTKDKGRLAGVEVMSLLQKQWFYKVLGDCDQMWPLRDAAGRNATQRDSTGGKAETLHERHEGYIGT